MDRATALAVPFQLRANDVVKHVVNVDSRFRDTPAQSRSTDYYFTLLAPVRNVLRIRITSVELPNNYFFFTAARRNVSLEVRSGPGLANTAAIVIPDGNYTAGDMLDALVAELAAAGLGWISVAFSEVEGAFTFAGNQAFAISTVYGSLDRPFDYGLGYYLGFTRGVHAATGPDGSGNWMLMSDRCAYFAGDNYVFLQVNDYDCVRHTMRVYDSTGRTEMSRDELTALAKVVIREPKNYMTFDDYASQHAKEVVFPAPTDVARLHVRLLDPYGEVMDFCGAQWSFSIEVLEVRNTTLYNALRDSLSLRYV